MRGRFRGCLGSSEPEGISIREGRRRSKLDGPFGSAENVPQLIKQLQKQYEKAVKDELYWEQLFHQNTIYSSTLAAVPYLAEIAR